VQVSAPDVNLEAAAELMADMARAPLLAEEDFESVRARAVDYYLLDASAPDAAATLAVPAVAFGEGACGQPGGGTASTLEAITHDDVRSFYREAFEPRNAYLILTGSVTPEAGVALAERLFGDWENPARAMTPEPAPQPDDGVSRSVLVDFGDAEQSAVVTVNRLPPRGDPDRIAIELANSIFGGGFSSRLSQEIRIERGLAYGANSSVRMDLHGGKLQAFAMTKNETAGEVVELILSELHGMAAAPPSAEELAARKAALIGEFGMSLETTDSFAGLLDGYAEASLPLAEYENYTEAVQAVAPEEVQRVAEAWFSRETADLIVVGDGEIVLPALEEMRSTVEVVPFEDFDPARPSLTAQN
jgi:zinc protease